MREEQIIALLDYIDARIAEALSERLDDMDGGEAAAARAAKAVLAAAFEVSL